MPPEDHDVDEAPVEIIERKPPADGLRIDERVMQVEKRIASSCAKSGRDYSEVKVVAVSKGRSFDEMREAYDSGQHLFGENKVKEAEQKWPLLPFEATLHMVGHLQKNKVKKAVEMFDCVHSVDGMELAKMLNRHAEDQQKSVKVFAQLNISGESTKYGFSTESAKTAVPRISELPFLDLQGLMTMAPVVKKAEEARPIFRRLREFRDRMETENGIQLRELSMGMTQDFEVAIEEGATYVRLGKAIFG